MTKVTLRQMLRAGVRAIADYTGTVLGLFLIQVLVAFGAGFASSQILAGAFAYRPLFDEGVDGDLAALIEALRGADATIAAITWVGLLAVILWVMVSWFLAGGLIAVLAARPQGRRDTARLFGSSGTTHFFALARLGVLSLVCHAIVLFVAMVGVGVVYPRIELALTLREVIGWLALGLAPAFAMTVVLWTIIDLARVELVLRRPGHERLGAVQAFARALVFVVQRPIVVVHMLAWVAAFVVVSVLYAWLAHDAAMLGAGGAAALLVVREGVALVRMALKVMLVGGQVEIGLSRPLPPRAPTQPPASR